MAQRGGAFSQQYFMTSAPMTVGNHIIVGTGNDLDSPGYLMSFDPESGAQQRRFYTVPMNPGDPGLDTWKSLDAARHGGETRGCQASTIRSRTKNVAAGGRTATNLWCLT